MATVVAVFRLPRGAMSTAADGAVIAASVTTGGISDRVPIAVVWPAPTATDDDLHRYRWWAVRGVGRTREHLHGGRRSVVSHRRLMPEWASPAENRPARRAAEVEPGSCCGSGGML